MTAAVFLLKFFLSFSICCISLTTHANLFSKHHDNNHGLYVGLMGGYGSTTWQNLAPSASNRNKVLDMSLPIGAQEGGVSWGAFAGMRLTKYIFLEASYKHYPTATVQFDPDSMYTAEHPGETILITKTKEVSVLSKIMIPVSDTKLKLYSGVGLSVIYRSDVLYDDSRFTPTFTLGTLFPITEQISMGLEAEYTIGYGESQLDPSKQYVPFLYAVLLRWAYHFK